MKKTETRDVTYESGTVTVAGKAKITVHTGTVRVTCVHSLFRPVHMQLRCYGPFYVTATVELPDGTLEAITDTRVGTSPFALGWR